MTREITPGRPTTRRYTKDEKDQAVRLVFELHKERGTTQGTVVRVAHARFEVINPFVDGNGRTGRMLIRHMLAGQLQIPAPVPVSVPWSRNTDSYIAGLRAFQDGDLDRWIEFATMSIVDAVQWIHTVEHRVSALIASLEERSRSRGNSVATRVIRDLSAPAPRGC